MNKLIIFLLVLNLLAIFALGIDLNKQREETLEFIKNQQNCPEIRTKTGRSLDFLFNEIFILDDTIHTEEVLKGMQHTNRRCIDSVTIIKP